jgi:hypothetical protein
VVSIGNPSDLPAVAPAPASAGHSRLGRWARRRARQLLWVVAILAVALVLTAAGVMLSRAARLFGLPDIGDPFDVPAFRALTRIFHTPLNRPSCGSRFPSSAVFSTPSSHFRSQRA